MQVLLVVLSLWFLGMMLTALAFWAAAGEGDAEEAPVASRELWVPAEQFFLGEAEGLVPSSGSLVAVSLLQLERHVRLEHAAAERFLRVLTVESLYAPTSSPLMG